MTKLLQRLRFRNRMSRVFLFGWALALAVLATATLPERANAQASQQLSYEKWLCTGSPGTPNTSTATCNIPGVSSVPAGTLVYYVIKVLNPPGSPPIPVLLNETYPAGFIVGSVVCTDSTSTTPLSGVTSSSTSMSASVTVPAYSGTVTCTIQGWFGKASPGVTNSVSFTEQPSGATGTFASSSTTVTGGQLNADLGITKTVSPNYPTVVDVSVTPQIVTFTITLTNHGPAPVDLGPFFQLHDTFALMPLSVPLKVNLVVGSQTCTHYNSSNAVVPGGDCLVPPQAPQILSGPPVDLYMVPTSSQHPFADWNFGSQLGHMANGDYLVLTYQVKISRVSWITCVKAANSDGLRNYAQFDLARTNNTTITEMVMGDNTTNPPNNTASDVNVFTGYYITDPTCASTLVPPPLSITKVQMYPGGLAPWSTIAWVVYRITVHNNNTTQFVAGIRFADSIEEGLATPPFTESGISCTTVPAVPACPGFGPPAHTYSYYTERFQAWNPTGAGPTFALAANATKTFTIRVHYHDPNCDSVPVTTPKLIINFGRITYTSHALNGNPPGTYNFDQWAYAVTKMQPPPACHFKVTKKLVSGQTRVHFSNPPGPPALPLIYQVTYQNLDPGTRVVGTVMDAVRITLPNYAASLPYHSWYACTQTGGVTGYNPGGGPLSPGNAVYTTTPAQGARIINNTSPVTFPSLAQLSCTVKIWVHPPPANNPFCYAGPPYADFENLALMDVSTTYNPNLPWPPTLPPYIYVLGAASNPPTPWETNWATVARHLPQCYNYSLSKTASNPTIPGTNNPAWTSATGVPQVNYTVTGTNTNTAPAAIPPSVHIFEAPGYPSSGTLTSSANWTAPLGLTLSHTVSPVSVLNGPLALGTVKNCANLQAVGTLGGPDWYAAWAPSTQPPAPTLQSCTSIPVLKTTTLVVRKKFVNATGSTIPILSPAFNVSVTCTPYNIPTTNLALAPVPATLTSSVSPPAQGFVSNVPVSGGETCTVTEPMPPPPTVPALAQKICHGTAYWDSSPAYAPAQTIPISGTGSNTVMVTNTLRCHQGPLTEFKIIKDVVDLTPGGANHPLTPYNVTLGCIPPSAPPSVVLTVGTPLNVVVPLGAMCTPNETLPAVPALAEQRCHLNALLHAYWETPPAYVPSSPFTINSAGQTVHVINVLRCGNPLVSNPGTLTVLKQVSGPNGVVAPPTAFSLSVKCGTNAPTAFSLNAGGMHSVLASPANCTVSETPPTPLTFAAPSCPTGQATWVTPPTYSPAANISVPNDAVGAVVVTNTYQCVPWCPGCEKTKPPTPPPPQAGCPDGQQLVHGRCKPICKDRDAHWNGRKCVSCDPDQRWIADRKRCVKGEVHG